ncbi:MAG: DUF2339 domain-containing protein [Verrucomicrobia bacterium]|nr:DUF2339 domain-containing protein [Verrucomicrobiota bacterium]
MSAVALLLALFLFCVLVVFPIWTLLRVSALRQQQEAQERKIRQLELELLQLRRDQPPETPAPLVAPDAPLFREPPVAAPAAPPPPAPIDVPAPSVASVTRDIPPPLSEPAPTPELPPPEPVPAAALRRDPEPVLAAPPPPPMEPPPAPPPAREPESLRINWEQFMGAKLFAWLGGLAGLLAIAFFVKYSFEHDLVPPEARVAIGFVVALGLVVGGLRIDRVRYAVTSQTLIATGIVSLYTVTFACRAVYHFPFFGPVPTFLLMVLITTAAFLLAVRLEAQVVAVLGILGGFLTPVLASSGQYNPVGLFGYIALLDAGLIAVALHRRWDYLVPLGATGTLVTLLGWMERHFNPERAETAALVGIVFAGLFLAAVVVARRRGALTPELRWSAVALALAGFGLALYFTNLAPLGARPGLIFAVVLPACLCLLVLAWIAEPPALAALAAAATAFVLVAWTVERCTAELAPTAMAICLGFCVLFLAAYFLAAKLGRSAREIALAAVTLPFVAVLLALLFLGKAEVAARPGLLLGFLLAADLCLLAVAWFDEDWPKLHVGAGLAVFSVLAGWMGTRLTEPLLPWALGFCLAFAALHTVFPLVLERRRPASAPNLWSQLFPPITLILLLLPLARLREVTLLFWPCVLLVDLLAMGVALLAASLAAVGATLVLTLLAAAVWILQAPAAGGVTAGMLVVVGGFAVIFFGAGLFFAQRLGNRGEGAGLPGAQRAALPAMSALLPFVLLILMTARVSLPDPSPLFGLALLLVVLLLGLTVLLLRSAVAGVPAGREAETEALGWLPACALAGVAALEYSWHARSFSIGHASIPLGWFLLFHAVFAVFPFVFARQFSSTSGPWVVAALSGAAHFPLVHGTLTKAWPHDFPGIWPALFALPPLASLAVVARVEPADGKARLNRLAAFGGVALLFITLIFPIQFERQWLTLGWALEGAALLWLYRRVPHAALPVIGIGLLVTAFARLALNPAVLSYHARGGMPVLNWYLYAYATVAACLWIGARWLSAAPVPAFALAPTWAPLWPHVPHGLVTGGVILAFLLLNIEIADFFSEPGQRVLVFTFSGNFGRDMTYTIAWALFALSLLLFSIWKRAPLGRYAALALLGTVVLKLFFHDLARLDALYRVGALLAVAVIATLASFAYQRFLPYIEKHDPPKP